jgi:hypothetical protein
MEAFLQSRVDKYLDLAGTGTTLREARAPFTSKDPRTSDARRPQCAQSQDARPWCQYSPQAVGDVMSPTAKESDRQQEGRLAPVAATILMKSLRAARMARSDLLRAARGLARYLTKWTTKQDEELYRLICYINNTKSWKMVGWVGDDLRDVDACLYSDSSFADTEDMRSTSGLHVCMKGRNTCFPIAGQSRKQDRVSSATTESELVVAHQWSTSIRQHCVFAWTTKQ